jgi:hypothetical protein
MIEKVNDEGHNTKYKQGFEMLIVFMSEKTGLVK